MVQRYETVTFLSDYGLVDEFVGVVHSVIRSIAPEVRTIDLTHQVPPYDVRTGGLALARSAPYLTPGVVLAVVDPGVATDRLGIAVEVGDGASVLVGPDNGLLAPAVAMCGGASRAVTLTNPDYQLAAPGPTFAGRDVFAPAAAHLCLGVELTELGDELDPVSLIPGVMPLSYDEDGSLVGEVLWIDRYGNAQLNVDPADIAELGDVVRISFGDERRAAKVVESFAEVGSGGVGLMIDSYGLLSIVVDRRSASGELGLQPAMAVRIDAFDDEPQGVTTPVELSGRVVAEPRVSEKEVP